GSLFADLTIVQKVESSGVMGQPPRNGTMTIYIKGSMAKIENMGPSMSEIVDLDSGKFYMMNATQKTVMVMTTDNIKQFSGMMGNGKVASPTAEKTGNSKTVNGFSCEEYKITTRGLVSSQTLACISDQIDTKDIEKFRQLSADLSKQFGGLPPEIKGYPVISDAKLTVMGKEVTTHSELVSVSKDAIPDSIFVVPPDYQVREMPKLPRPGLATK
ncbi:MAG: DUF4412 domain-containing protein, partial [Chlamydiae bacterium]|nr:DUF4412 domain-containing protein [Chlamydiota bacterium]MBI3276259.1 DUF4412 domain-containing protein [Chlamydiota bacterium]